MQDLPIPKMAGNTFRLAMMGRTGSAGRCGLLAYAKAHAGRAWMHLPSCFEGHGLRELIAATSAAGTAGLPHLERPLKMGCGVH